MKKINTSAAFLIVLLSLKVFGLTTQENQSRNIAAYLEVVELLEKRYSYYSSVQYCDSILFLVKNTDDQLLLAHILQKKGTLLIKKNEYDSARIYLHQAHNLAKRDDNDTIQATIEKNLGYLAQKDGYGDSVLYYYNSAIRLYGKAGDSVGLAKIKSQLAIFYKLSGDYEMAIKNILEAKRILKKYEIQDSYLRSLINLANIYERLQEYDTALAYYEQCYEKGLELDNSKLSSIALTNKAVIYYRQKKYDESLTAFLRVIEFNEKIGDKRALAKLYSNISLVYEKLGEEVLKRKSIEKSLQYATELDDKVLQLSALNNLGLFYKYKMEYTKAENHFKESLLLAEQMSYKRDKRSAYKNLSEVYEITGNNKQALEYSRKYADINDSILNETKVKAIEDFEAKYRKKEDEAKILQLQNETVKKELEKKSIRSERNTIFSIAAAIVVLLIVGLIYFRMKSRKDKIIASQKIQQLEDEKRLMAAQSVLVGEEKERKRIAQELHDGIGVLLSTASIHFSSVVDKTSDVATSQMIGKANELLQKAGGEVRKISHNMMPGVLSKFGLREALEDLFDGLSDSGQIEIDCDIDMTEERLPENTEIMIYRVVQELINNTLKHAKAKTISFSMWRKLTALVINYNDDGIGFDSDAIPEGKSLGLSGIHSRIDFLKGRFVLESTIEKGTTYKILIPINGKNE